MLPHVETAELQRFLDGLPAALALLDAKGEIIWINAEFIRVTGLANAELLGKKTQSFDEDLQQLFTEETVALPATSKRAASWLTCISMQLGDKRLRYCSDVTQLHNLIHERESLKSKVAELNPVDEITGIPNRRSLFQSLEQQTSRSRRYGNPLSVMILRLLNLNKYREFAGEANTNHLLLQLSQMLNDQMRWADVIGRIDDNEFLFILPETEESVAHELHDKLKERMQKLELPGIEDNGFELIIDFGMAAWRKGDDVGMLMQRARVTLDDAKSKKVAV